MVALTLTMKSRNAKVGPMPVSTSDKSTCAPSCPFKGKGCYAESGPLAIHWAKITAGTMPTAMDGMIFATRSRPCLRGRCGATIRPVTCRMREG